MARAAGNTMKVDVALPMEMFETISRIARESNAPIHHRSGEPVVSPTIIRLIGLGILSATDNPEMMTADISRTVADPRVDILSDRVRALEDRLSDDVRSIAESAVEQALSPVREMLSNARIGTHTDITAAGVQAAIDKAIAPIQSDLAELLLRIDELKSVRLPGNSNQKAKLATDQALKASVLGNEVQKWVKRCEADPGLKAAIEEGLGQNLTGKALVDWVFSKGFGANENAKPFDASVAGRMRGAIEFLNSPQNPL
jgi:hypothetical protein